MWKKFLLRDEAPADGNGPGQNPPQPPTQAPQPAAPPPNPTPTAPPAARTVLDGDRTERELELIEENKRKDETIKNRETKISELEDRLHQLTTPSTSPAPEPGDEDACRWRPFKS